MVYVLMGGHFFDDFRPGDYSRPEGHVTVDLAGDSVEWPVHGLDARGLAVVDEAGLSAKRLQAIADAVAKAAGGGEGIGESLETILGIDEKSPASLLRRYAIFEEGTAESHRPRRRPETVNFARTFPVAFKKITDQIWILTEGGPTAKKKPTASGSQESAKTLPSLTDSGNPSSDSGPTSSPND